MLIGSFPECLSQRILATIILVGDWAQGLGSKGILVVILAGSSKHIAEGAFVFCVYVYIYIYI